MIEPSINRTICITSHLPRSNQYYNPGLTASLPFVHKPYVYPTFGGSLTTTSTFCHLATLRHLSRRPSINHLRPARPTWPRHPPLHHPPRHPHSTNPKRSNHSSRPHTLCPPPARNHNPSLRRLECSSPAPPLENPAILLRRRVPPPCYL